MSETFRNFQKALQNFTQLPEKSGNFRKFQNMSEHFGNFLKISETVRKAQASSDNFRKVQKIFMDSKQRTKTIISKRNEHVKIEHSPKS